MNGQREIEGALQRRTMTPEHREALAEANTQAPDWRGRCRKCGVVLTGTLVQLREHRCDQPTV